MVAIDYNFSLTYNILVNTFHAFQQKDKGNKLRLADYDDTFIYNTKIVLKHTTRLRKE